MALGATYHEGPFQRIVEVGWGGRVAILTMTVTNANRFWLKRATPVTPTPIRVETNEDPGIHDEGQPDYLAGDEILKEHWKSDFIEYLRLPIAPGSIEIYGPWGSTPIYSLAAMAYDPAPTIGAADPRFFDTYVYGSMPLYRVDFWTGEYIYGTTYYDQSYLSWTTRIDDHPLDGYPAIVAVAAALGAELIHVSLPSEASDTLHDLLGTYTSPVLNGDGSLNHIYSDPLKYGHRQYNPYNDPDRVGWWVYKIPNDDNPYPGLYQIKRVYLINMGKLGASGLINLGQSDGDTDFSSPPIKPAADFTCQFELKVYSSGKLFAGAAQTVTHSGGGDLIYNVTKTLDFAALGDSLLQIDRNGWVELP